MAERKIFFVRHGESQANLKDVFAGQRDDCYLTERGREQAKSVADELIGRGIKFDRIICSPLVRAKETAWIIASRMGLIGAEVVYDPRLMEYDMGDMSGKPRIRMTSEELISAPGAEDPVKFRDRVVPAFKEAGTMRGDTLIVGHGGVYRAYVADETGVDPENFYDLPLTPNARAIELENV